MGQMTRKLFRPRKGQTLASYTAAVADGTMYPADWVALSTTAPSSQGASGVLFGDTLAATDYVECTLADSDNLGSGFLTLGVLMGKSIGAVKDWTNVTSAVVADGDVVIIQGWGVHPNGRQAASGVLGDYLSLSATAGEPTNGTSAAITPTFALQPVGVCMIATGTYKRVTAADEDGSVVFVTCFNG